MNWKAEAKEKLRRYDAMRLATINIPEEVERLERVPTVQVFPEGVGAVICQPIEDEYMRHMEVETFGIEYPEPVVKRWSTKK